ncbi:MAG: FkbM family methyltransferase [Gemmatimonadaceae bacterium]|nr:FkbM family methyltransferase [Gemmatimonadaceae bacterium]
MSVTPDDAARALLERALADEALVRHPAPQLTRGARIAIYGAGNVGREVSQLLQAAGITVLHFIDARAASVPTVDGLPVLPPHVALDPSLPVVIAVFNREADPRGIHATVRKAGAQCIIDFLALHAQFASALGDRYWLVSQAALRSQAPAMRDGLDRWRDVSSREHYARLLAYRLTGDPAHLPNPSGGVPYRPDDLPKPSGRARFVDGGAFDGDTIRAWLAAAVEVERYWGFEPDPANFAALERWKNGSVVAASDFTLERAALGRHDGAVRFEAGAGEASRVADGPEGFDVRLQAIDSVLHAEWPTEIKLDIEGAEPDALEGARQTILKATPRLAICAYHRADHLWSIAAWIEALNAGYSLYLRPHAHSGFDTVTYALPPDRG